MCSSNELQKSIKKVLMRVSRELQESFKKASREFQESLKRATGEFQESFKRASRVLQKSFKRASREFQESIKRAWGEHVDSARELRELKSVQESLREHKRVRKEGVLGGVALGALVVLILLEWTYNSQTISHLKPLAMVHIAVFRIRLLVGKFSANCLDPACRLICSTDTRQFISKRRRKALNISCLETWGSAQILKSNWILSGSLC